MKGFFIAAVVLTGFCVAGCEVTVTSDIKTQYYYMEVGRISTNAPRITNGDLDIAYPGNYFSDVPNNWWFRDTPLRSRTEEQIKSNLASLNFTSSKQNAMISKLKSSGSVLYLYLRQDNYYGYIYIEYE